MEIDRMGASSLVRTILGVVAAILVTSCASQSALTDTATNTAAPSRAGDLAAFRKEFLEKDKSYSTSARTEAETLLANLESDADSLSNAAFELRLAEIVAKADNGHTLYFSGFWQKRYNRIPLKYLILNDKLYVGAANEPYKRLIGAEITRIDGETWQAVRQKLAQYQGGVDAWRAQYLPFFLESPEILFTAGITKASDKVTLSGINAVGKKFREKVMPGNNFPPLKGIELYLPISRVQELTRDGLGPDLAGQPLYLQDLENPFRMTWLDDDIAYIQFKSNAGEYQGLTAKQFSDNLISILKERTPSNIILDQRFNSGGNLNNTRDLMQALPRLVDKDGKNYTITSGHTFSAGIASIGYLKQAGGDRVVIVDEPIGDRLEFWAEGGLVELPDSGYGVFYAAERHNYMTGCPEEDCYENIRVYPIRVSSLAPDFPTPLTYEAYAAGRDPAFEKAISLIEGGE